MSNLEIQIDGDRTVFAPGGEIRGKVRWHLDNVPDALELALFWHTEGKGIEDGAVAESVRFDSPGPLGEKEFRLPVPVGPYSFSGGLISIRWALELVLSSKGKEFARKQITISPIGKEIAYPAAVYEGPEEKAKRFLDKIITTLRGNPMKVL